MFRISLACLTLILTLSGTIAAADGSLGYYRYPAIAGDTVVFAAEGDLWSVAIDGGVARRITSHPGEETHPALSPDGRTLAFSATYEGPTEVYTIALPGGVPQRWTYEASPSFAIGFAPDGRLLYSTREYSTLPDSLIVALDLTTGARERIPLAQASDGVYDDAGRTFYFARPDFHRNNTKRYQGGTARDIWKFSSGDPEATNLTPDFPGENHSPMWWNGRLYYVNDRDGTMNLWSIRPDGEDRKQHTRHSGWDVLAPGQGGGRIVYQLGADLRVYDIDSDRDSALSITLASDFDQLREKWVDDPMQYVTSANLHPEGESVVLTSRGRIFVAPAKSGRLVRASPVGGVRYRDAAFLPGSDSLMALSDESGELEWVRLPANGVGAPEALTSDGQILRFRGVPSPDGRWIAYEDQNRDLWLLDVASGAQTRASVRREGVGFLAWSPDSRWLAFEETALNSFDQIILYSVADGRRLELTGDRVHSVSPAWSRDGRFIYFLSDRNLRSLVGSPWGLRQPEPFFDKTFKIYEVALQPDLRSPFQPDDELQSTKEPGEQEEDVTVTIVAEGLVGRLREVPVEPGNYRNLTASGDGLYFVERDSGPRAPSHLKAIEFGPDKKVATVAEAMDSYQVSANGRKMMIRKGQDIFVLDARPRSAGDLRDHRVDLSGWSFPIDVREDLRQLFVDAWRLERDYFWDPGMHGLDWDAMRDKYLPLVDRVTTRDELNDLIGQLVGELSALHVSVRGGDLRRGEDQIRMATLGARLVRDEAAGGYRVDYVYQADPDYPDELSPLAAPGVDVAAGDVITSINGTPTLSVTHLNALLRNQDGRQVLLEVRPAGDAARRHVVVTPTAGEAGLRYRDWEYTRRLEVEDRGDGRIGYVHLRAMGGGNLTEWYRQFYPVFNRQGLILDMRHNRGGNIDSFILARLIRQAWFYWKGRVGRPYWNMQYAFRGHMVVLQDAQTASDGEAFTEGFRRLGLGKIIGTRTWGGEIWLSNNNRLTDGGLARAPQTGVYGPEREWLIEGHGVDPDIEVDNLPHETFQGRDAQLEAAIAHLQELIRKDPRTVPPPPPYPDKSFEYPPER